MANLFGFLSQNFTASPLEIAKKKVRWDMDMRRTLEVLDSNPNATPEEIAAVLGYRVDAQGNPTAGFGVSPQIVSIRHMPYAKQLLADASKAALPVPAQSQQIQPTSAQQNQMQSDQADIVINVPVPGAATDPADSKATIDALERENIRLVMNAASTKKKEHKLRQWSIDFFKLVGPYLVLVVTIPETVWTFQHMYTHPDDMVLIGATWLFAFVLDFGYLAITNLLSSNKEAIQRRRQRNLVVGEHETQMVQKQERAWWVATVLDSGSQIIFLVVATWGSKMFPIQLTIGLAVGRVTALALVMWVVSFAALEIATRVEEVVQERLEMAEGLQRMGQATSTARKMQQAARLEMEEEEMDMQRKREENDFLADIRRKNFKELQDLKDAQIKNISNGNDPQQKKLP